MQSGSLGTELNTTTFIILKTMALSRAEEDKNRKTTFRKPLATFSNEANESVLYLSLIRKKSGRDRRIPRPPCTRFIDTSSNSPVFRKTPLKAKETKLFDHTVSFCKNLSGQWASTSSPSIHYLYQTKMSLTTKWCLDDSFCEFLSFLQRENHLTR